MNITDQPLKSRVEEASLNAWPALKQVLLDGWVLRFAQGFTKRSNCVVPLYPSPGRQQTTNDPDLLVAKVRYCENLYAAAHLQCIFRLNDIESDDTGSAQQQLDQVLTARGYEFLDPSVVLSAPLEQAFCTEITSQTESESGSESALRFLNLEQWLAAYCQLTGMQEPGHTLHRLILNSIATECGFAVLFEAQQPVACGLAVLDRELVGLFDIFTDPARRQQGYGRVLVTGIMQWAAQHGAERAYLQMVRSNAPAAALYQELGFEQLYEYWYRVRSRAA